MLVERDADLAPQHEVGDARVEVVGEVVGQQLVERRIGEHGRGAGLRGRQARVERSELVAVPAQLAVDHGVHDGGVLRGELGAVLLVELRDARRALELLQLARGDEVEDLVPGEHAGGVAEKPGLRDSRG